MSLRVEDFFIADVGLQGGGGEPLSMQLTPQVFTRKRNRSHARGLGPVAGLVGIEGGVVSGVINLESPGVIRSLSQPV
jgi:hypothetical protein